MRKPPFPSLRLLSSFFLATPLLRQGVFSVLLSVAVFSAGCTTPVSRQETQDVSSNQIQELAQQEDQVDVPVVLAARFKIKPDKREQFLELATATLEPTRTTEEGNISYSFYEESTVPNSFIYFEEWESREALAIHLKKPYTEQLLEKFPEMLDGEANIRVYDIENVTYGLDVE
ncbi:MAG: putative quinol monooxygenase [Coleofasciculus sp. C1-SOL-03]|uniref:putative quinol monooxygenase n=1 Tax=Coleofasciculus sp. C1-SOL-03 TaxID=3069522 RepID=UPI0032FA40B3